MLGYVTIGTDDMARATGFWDQITAMLGGGQAMSSDRYTFYASPDSPTMLAVFKPYDGNPTVPGNGNMIALNAGDRAKVDEIYKKAIELGASCEGEPGERMPIFYGAYFRDLDGNKVCVFEMKQG